MGSKKTGDLSGIPKSAESWVSGLGFRGWVVALYTKSPEERLSYPPIMVLGRPMKSPIKDCSYKGGTIPILAAVRFC